MENQSIPDIRGIMELLPHRYPMLLVDKVLEMEPGVRIKAVKNVSFNEPFFQGHFPDAPVMPGVLIIEAMAQAGGILAFASKGDEARKKLVYFMGIDGARFRRPVVPGDQLVMECRVLKLKTRFCQIEAKSWVDGELAAEAVLMSTIMEREG